MMEKEYLTFTIGKQIFGAVVSEIRYIYSPSEVTYVPLAPPEIAGLLNLRGRIVTAIDMRARLGLPRAERQGHGHTDLSETMAIGIEHNGESYALLVDSIGEVICPEKSDAEQNPSNLDQAWRNISKGMFKLKHGLMIVMDIERLLSKSVEEAA